MNLFAEENIQKHEASIPSLLLQMLEQSLRYLQQQKTTHPVIKGRPSFSCKSERNSDL